MKAICGKCKQEFTFVNNNTNDEFIIVQCSLCGQKNRINNLNITPQNVNTIKEPQQLNVIFCSKCGNKNTSDESFCAKCGSQLKNIGGYTLSPISETTDSSICRNCGEKNENDYKFCCKCGNLLLSRDNKKNTITKVSTLSSNGNAWNNGVMAVLIIFTILFPVIGFGAGIYGLVKRDGKENQGLILLSISVLMMIVYAIVLKK